MLQGLTAHLTSASKLAPPAASAAAAQQWVAAAGQLMQQSASFRTEHMTQLRQCENDVEETVQSAFLQLKQQVSLYHSSSKHASRTTKSKMQP